MDKMILFKLSKDLEDYSQKMRKSADFIGFVPTMGALHDGHLSLIVKSRQKCATTIVSIFINPTQFNNPDDFKKYPVTLEKDIYLLEKNHSDAVFLPTYEEIYGQKVIFKHYDLGYLENILEGKYRPGHFQGVCQVVDRLLNIVKPTHLFLGQKDYQQCMVIKKLIDLMPFHIDLIICPTLREPDGLAMSSRNLRLSEQQRKQATEIYRCLVFLHKHLSAGSLEPLKSKVKDYLTNNGFKVDYVEICDADSLISVSEWDGKQRLIALVATYVGEVRLIDNMLLNDSRIFE